MVFEKEKFDGFAFFEKKIHSATATTTATATVITTLLLHFILLQLRWTIFYLWDND